MKTESPKISIILYQGKVSLRVNWKGRAIRSLGISATEEEFDSNLSLLNKKHKDYKSLNLQIQKEKNAVIERYLTWDSQGIDYTAKSLLNGEKTPQKTINKLMVQNVLLMYQREHNVEDATLVAFQQVTRLYTEYFDNKPLDAIIEGDLKKFAKWMNTDKGLAKTSINLYLAKLKALFQFLIDEEMISKSPFRKWKYGKEYQQSEILKALTKTQMKAVEILWATIYLEYHAPKFSITAELLSKERIDVSSLGGDRCSATTEFFSLTVFIMMYRLNGIAPTDLLHIRKDQCSIQIIDGDKYFSVVRLRRQKTNVQVPILVKITPILELILSHLDSFDSDYLIGKEVGRSMNVWLNRSLKSSFEFINNNHKKLLGDVRNDWNNISSECTLYSARHSFASHYISNGGDLITLAELMGRSVQNIFVYIEQLLSKEELAKKSAVIMNR